MTRDRVQAAEWLSRFEGAGLDGVIAKPADGTYQPGKRAMIKVKHARTADCVVAGFRWHKAGQGELVGSLLLGLYDDKQRLHHVGVTSSFTMAMRRQLAAELAPLRERALEDHPWREWAEVERRDDAHAGRPEPLERRQGPVVGAAADRARLRGEVRPHAGPAIPSRGGLPALASRQARRATAATTSSRSRLLTSSRRCSARPAGIADAAPLVGHVLVRVERLLRRTQVRRHVLKVHADPRPRAEAAAQRVDEHVGRFQVRAGLRMTRLPALEAGERVRFLPRAADFDQRMARRPAA